MTIGMLDRVSKSWERPSSHRCPVLVQQVEAISCPLSILVLMCTYCPEQYPELFATAYTENDNALNEAPGRVHVWNIHMQDRPEFTFTCQVPSGLHFRKTPCLHFIPLVLSYLLKRSGPLQCHLCILHSAFSFGRCHNFFANHTFGAVRHSTVCCYVSAVLELPATPDLWGDIFWPARDLGHTRKGTTHFIASVAKCRSSYMVCASRLRNATAKRVSSFCSRRLFSGHRCLRKRIHTRRIAWTS